MLLPFATAGEINEKPKESSEKIGFDFYPYCLIVLSCVTKA